MSSPRSRPSLQPHDQPAELPEDAMVGLLTELVKVVGLLDLVLDPLGAAIDPGWPQSAQARH